MSLRWLLQGAAELPPGSAWLAPEERAALAGMRFEKRRADYRLGRWTAKRALAPTGADAALAEIAIRNDAEGAPSAWRGGAPVGEALSISHRDGRALCVVAPEGRVGCDLERIEERSAAFVEDWLDAEERARVARLHGHARRRHVALVWSGKESALKALGIGLRRDTRSLRVELPGAPGTPARRYEQEREREHGREHGQWQPLRVRLCEGGHFDGWWREHRGFVLTLVARPAPQPPQRCALPPTATP